MKSPGQVFIFLPSIHLRSGIYRYCFGIICALADKGENLQIISLPGNIVWDDFKTEKGDLVNISHLEIRSLFQLKKIFKKKRGVIYFLTPDLRSLVAILLIPHCIKKILTIHDVYCFRAKFSFKEVGRWVKELTRSFLIRISAILNSVFFIAISGATHRDVSKILHLSPGRIRIIYPGTTEYFFENSSDCKPDLENFLLSHFAQTKFFPILALFLKKYPDFSMIFFWSDPSFIYPAKKVAKKLGIDKKLIFKVAISDAELSCLYRRAACFIRYVDDEGFGMPVAEAMASGCPILVSDRGSLPDVVRIPEIVLPIDAIEQWLNMLDKIIKDKKFRDELIKKEKVRAESLRWTATAQEIIKYYDYLRN